MGDSCGCGLCERRAAWGSLFVAEKGGTFVCDDCIPLVEGLSGRLGDDDVEVWQEGGGGWTSREGMVCRLCAREIEVVLASEAVEHPPAAPARAPSDYERKVEARLARMRASAARARAAGEAAMASAKAMADRIPFGEPIHVGHHSERRDRNFRGRIDAKFRKGFGLLDDAKTLDRRADAAERSTAISSDDPDAVDKLRAKLAESERQHAALLEVNRRLRGGATHAEVASLLDWWRDPVARLGIWAGMGHKTLPLGNSAAEQRRLRDRIAVLEKAAAAPARAPETVGAVRIEEGDNRVRLVFQGKPAAEVRALLKTGGWRWSPTAGAWQRHASANAWDAARRLASRIAGVA